MGSWWSIVVRPAIRNWHFGNPISHPTQALINSESLHPDDWSFLARSEKNEKSFGGAQSKINAHRYFAQTKTKQEFRSAIQGQYSKELNQNIKNYE